MNKNNRVVIFENGKMPLSRVNENVNPNSNDKKYIFQGVCATFGHKNANGRYYDKNEYLEHFSYLLPQIQSKSLAGSLDHPDDEDEDKDIFTPKMKDLSHIVLDLWYDEPTNSVMIKIELLDTTWGKDAKACADAGMPIFISSRSSGYIEDDGRVILDTIHTYDIVYRPGFAEAKLQPIVESYENKNSYVTIMKSKNNGNITLEQFGQFSSKVLESIDNITKIIESMDEADPEPINEDPKPDQTTEFDYSTLLSFDNVKDQNYMTAMINYVKDVDNDLINRYAVVSHYIDKCYAIQLEDYDPNNADAYIRTVEAFIESMSSNYCNTNDYKDAMILERVNLARRDKKYVMEKLSSKVLECDSAKSLVSLFISDDTKSDEDKVDIIKKFSELYPDEVTGDVTVDNYESLWNNDTTNDIESLALKLHKEITGRYNATGVLSARINSVTEYAEMIAMSVNSSIDRLAQSIESLVEKNISTNTSIKLLEERLNKVTEYAEMIASTVNAIADHSDMIVTRINNVQDYANTIADATNNAIDSIESKISDISNDSTNALDNHIKTVLEKRSANKTTSSRITICEGRYLVPLKYQKAFKSISDDDRQKIEILFESRNPKSEIESLAIWESLGLSRNNPMQSGKVNNIIGLGYSVADIDKSLQL